VPAIRASVVNMAIQVSPRILKVRFCSPVVSNQINVVLKKDYSSTESISTASEKEKWMAMGEGSR
jgi:hypothetical protein